MSRTEPKEFPVNELILMTALLAFVMALYRFLSWSRASAILLIYVSYCLYSHGHLHLPDRFRRRFRWRRVQKDEDR